MDKREKVLTNKVDAETAIQDLHMLKDRGKTWTKPRLKILDAKRNTLADILGSSGDGPGYS